MQKYKLWIIGVVIIIILVTLIYWLAPNHSNINTKETTSSTDSTLMGNNTPNLPENSSSIFKSHSQLDTEINCALNLDGANRLIVNEQTKSCFEYFITQYGEKSMEQIHQDFNAYMNQNYKEPVLSQVLDLWKRYLEYRNQLTNIKSPSNLSTENPKYYRAIFEGMNNLRKQYFSNYEIEGLFGAEDTYHLYTLNRMEILSNKNLNEQEKAKKLKALFNELPPAWQENLEQLNKLEDLQHLTADIKARGGSAEEIRQMRLNLVGVEATQRLENLDVERNEWKTKVTQYLSARDVIMKSGMQDSAKEKAVQQLKTQHFNHSQEQLRLETFEHMHDQGAPLPFAE